MNTREQLSEQNSREFALEVPGARLAGDLMGSGPTLVQLHGLSSSRARDEKLELNLAEDVPDRTMFRYDARGHGHSTGRAVPDDYTWPVLARDLLAALDAVAPGECVDAIGQSMGAGTLLHAALLDPARFRSLTLVIPPTAWETRPAQSEAYLAAAKLVEEHGLEAFARVGASLPRPPAAPPAPVTFPDVTEELLPSILRGASKSDLPPVERIATIQTRTLIFGWIEDPAHPLSTAQALHQHLPNSELVVSTTPEESLQWGRRTAEHITAEG